MKRRDFLKATAAASLFASFPGLIKASSDYNGKFLVTVLASGGWDPTSFCDPKMNVAGEKIINNWAATNSTQTVGNINYAPFADNDAFFKAHYQKMLVINGVDVKSNSHTVGKQNNMTGIKKDGYPSLAALFAASNRTQQLMPWLVTSGPRSGRLLAPSTIASSGALNTLRKLADTNKFRTGRADTYLQTDELALIRQFRQDRASSAAADKSQLIKQRSQYNNYLASNYSDGSFELYLSLLENADTKGYDISRRYFSQAASTMAAFKAGISLSADISIGGFDTHRNHDTNHPIALARVTQTIDLLWYMAAQYNIEDRLVVHLVSDFGRTNRYNSGAGKDHWSITSNIIMSNNLAWGNRVVGATDAKHFAEKIDFNSLKQDSTSGSNIEPRHIMTALRQYMSVDNTAASNKFDLNTAAIPDFFNGSLIT